MTDSIHDRAQSIVNELIGITSTLVISNAMAALSDLLIEQATVCKEAHKKVTDAKEEESKQKVELTKIINSAKDLENNEDLIYKKIENLYERIKRQRQELKSDAWNSGL